MQKLWRRFTYLITVTLFVMVSTIINVSPAYAHSTNNSGGGAGNNGTLKVHEIGTPSGTENNDPKVCALNFEGFSFDASQSGYINIDGQGQTTQNYDGQYAFGPTDSNGYAISQNFNNGAGTAPIANGQYKATLYGKDIGGNIDLNNVKAKSKVFKVDCVTPTQVVVPTPAENDPCGSGNATWIQPTNTASITWSLVNSHLVATTVVGYEFTDGTTSHDYGIATDSNVACPNQMIAIPAAPASNDPCGLDNATWSKPSDTAEITWSLVNGHLIATTTTGYEFTDGSTTHDYGVAVDSNVACIVQVTPTPVTFGDVCGTGHDTYTIPSKIGVVYKVNGQVTLPSTYPGKNTVTVTASAANGYALTGMTTWSYTFTDNSCHVTLCHADAWGWDEITINDDSSLTDFILKAHTYHSDDIIPVFDYFNGSHYAGKNLATDFNGRTGQQILDHDCKVPCKKHHKPQSVKPAEVTFTAPTCQNPLVAYFNVPTTAHVVYKVGSIVVSGKNLISVPGSVTVTAYPESGAYTLTGTTSWSDTFTMPEGCGGGGQVTPPTPPTVVATPSTCLDTALATGSIAVTVTNPYNISEDYTVELGGVTKPLSLGANATDSVAFSGLAAGNYTATVTGGDAQATTNTTITSCIQAPIGGQGAGPIVTASAPASQQELTDTGVSVLATSLTALFLSITATGIMSGRHRQTNA